MSKPNETLFTIALWEDYAVIGLGNQGIPDCEERKVTSVQMYAASKRDRDTPKEMSENNNSAENFHINKKESVKDCRYESTPNIYRIMGGIRVTEPKSETSAFEVIIENNGKGERDGEIADLQRQECVESSKDGTDWQQLAKKIVFNKEGTTNDNNRNVEEPSYDGIEINNNNFHKDKISARRSGLTSILNEKSISRIGMKGLEFSRKLNSMPIGTEKTNRAEKINQEPQELPEESTIIGVKEYIPCTVTISTVEGDSVTKICGGLDLPSYGEHDKHQFHNEKGETKFAKGVFETESCALDNQAAGRLVSQGNEQPKRPSESSRFTEKVSYVENAICWIRRELRVIQDADKDLLANLTGIRESMMKLKRVNEAFKEQQEILDDIDDIFEKGEFENLNILDKPMYTVGGGRQGIKRKVSNIERYIRVGRGGRRASHY
eukprot:gene17355-8942_t